MCWDVMTTLMMTLEDERLRKMLVEDAIARRDRVVNYNMISRITITLSDGRVMHSLIKCAGKCRRGMRNCR